jgi:hypothetical protein
LDFRYLFYQHDKSGVAVDPWIDRRHGSGCTGGVILCRTQSPDGEETDKSEFI